jgi:hypothetical protein
LRRGEVAEQDGEEVAGEVEVVLAEEREGR